MYAARSSAGRSSALSITGESRAQRVASNLSTPLWRSRLEKLSKEHASFYPVSLHRPFSKTQLRCNLHVRHSAKKPILDDACEPWVNERQPIQRIIDLYKGIGGIVYRNRGIVERN